MTALHERYADKIISLAQQSTVDGSPINRPLWWIDPLDPIAQVIDSGTVNQQLSLNSFQLQFFFKCRISAG
jgi:hypothetical protein